MEKLTDWHKTAAFGTERCLHLPLTYCLDFHSLESLGRQRPYSHTPHLILIDNQPTFLFFDRTPEWTQKQWRDLTEGDFENLPLTHSRVDSQNLFRLNGEDVSQLNQILGNQSEKSDGSSGSPQLGKLITCLKSDEAWAQRALFPVNNESLRNTWQSQLTDLAIIQNIYLTASGLKPLSILSAFQKSKAERIIFYDLSPIALHYYQDLIRDWPFQEFGSYLWHRMQNERDPLSIPLRVAFALPDYGPLGQGHQQVIQTATDREIKLVEESLTRGQRLEDIRPWLMDREISFHELNLLTDPQSLPLFSGGNFLWISNILSYRPTFLKLGGSSGLRRAFDSLLARLHKTDKPSYLWGDLRIYGADWFSDAGTLIKRDKDDA